MNDIRQRPVNTGALFWGFTLIGFGILLMLDRFGIADVHFFFRRLWPLFIIVAGLSRLFRRRSVWGGVWLICVGAWLQIATLHVFGMTFNSSWPLLLIALGAGVILRALLDATRGRHPATAIEEHHEQ